MMGTKLGVIALGSTYIQLERVNIPFIEIPP